MKYSILLVLVLAFSASGCCYSVTGQGWCPCVQANCCSWDLYKKCDLIEGSRGCCPAQCVVQQGVVSSGCIGQPTAPAPIIIEQAPAEIMEEAPAAAPTAGAIRGGDDLGAPPAGG